jgi:hypothetical protein
MSKKLTPEQKAAVALVREMARIEDRYGDRLIHYPEAERALIFGVFLVLPRLGKAGMDAAIIRLIRRNFIACEPKIGWQDAAKAILVRAGMVQP